MAFDPAPANECHAIFRICVTSRSSRTRGRLAPAGVMNKFNLMKTQNASRHDPTRFARLIQQIESERDRLQKLEGRPIPWRGLYGPRRSLDCPNGIVILGINPGGEVDEADKAETPRTAYLYEAWTNSDYRDQVVRVVSAWLAAGGARDCGGAWDDCVTSNLVPFRSRNFSKLSRRRECRQFARKALDRCAGRNSSQGSDWFWPADPRRTCSHPGRP